jgi:hypothetical protein
MLLFLFVDVKVWSGSDSSMSAGLLTVDLFSILLILIRQVSLTQLLNTSQNSHRLFQGYIILVDDAVVGFVAPFKAGGIGLDESFDIGY